MAQWGGSPGSRIYFTPFPREVFGFLGVREVRSRSDAERVATTFPEWGGGALFPGAVVVKVNWVGLGCLGLGLGWQGGAERTTFL